MADIAAVGSTLVSSSACAAVTAAKFVSSWRYRESFAKFFSNPKDLDVQLKNGIAFDRVIVRVCVCPKDVSHAAGFHNRRVHIVNLGVRQECGKRSINPLPMFRLKLSYDTFSPKIDILILTRYIHSGYFSSTIKQ